MRLVKVVLCGPSRLARYSVQRQLRRLPASVMVVGEAPSINGARVLTRRHEPDVVILIGDQADPGAVELIQNASSRRKRVILIPERPLGDVHGASVLPRSRHTNRSLTAAMGRIVSRL